MTQAQVSRLAELLAKSTRIKAINATDETEFEINDFVLLQDGTLELWQNSEGYEI